MFQTIMIFNNIFFNIVSKNTKYEHWHCTVHPVCLHYILELNCTVYTGCINLFNVPTPLPSGLKVK